MVGQLLRKPGIRPCRSLGFLAAGGFTVGRIPEERRQTPVESGRQVAVFPTVCVVLDKQVGTEEPVSTCAVREIR